MTDRLAEIIAAVGDGLREWRDGDFGLDATELLGGIATLRSGDDRGNFDELVAHGVDLHIEMLDDGCLWLSFCKPRSNSRVTLVASSKKRMSIGVDEELEE